MKVTTDRAALLVTVFSLLVLSTACQTSNQPKAESSPAASPVASSTTQPPVTKTETASTPAVSLATPTDTYKTGYAARQKKDLETLKRVLSKDAIGFLTDIGNTEKKSLDDQLRGLAETPQAATAETRNEKISGNRATLEYLDETGKWTEMQFVKEGNEWKIDLPKGGG